MPSIKDLVRDAGRADEPARQTRAAARLMSLLEREPQGLPALFEGTPIEAWPQPRLVLGITGAPGSGKSTLTDQLVAAYRARFPERRVGVIAVDPSSPFTGGSVLGDRVRMMRHATDPHVFIRSLATRGHLGGLSLGVKGVLRVMGLIGCDVVFIETVGVGQSEVEVAGVADLVTVVLAPGQGDSIQMLKAGLMEVGDLIVINKADLDGAQPLHAQLLAALSLLDDGHEAVVDVDEDLADAALSRRRPGKPEALLVSASDGVGIEALVDRFEERAARSRPQWQARRDAAVRDDVREAVLEEARQWLAARLDGSGPGAIRRVLEGELSVAGLTRALLQEVADAAPQSQHPAEL